MNSVTYTMLVVNGDWMIPTIAVLGTTKSGKTILIEYLISNLSQEGLRIGTIKHIHDSGFSIDAKGKDTWRLSLIHI